MSKYVLINRCVGTEPYITEALEYDIKDVFSLMIVKEEDVEFGDYIKSKPTEDMDSLNKLLDEEIHNQEMRELYLDSVRSGHMYR